MREEIENMMIETPMTDWKEEILAKWRKKEKKSFEVTDTLRDRLAREFHGEVFYREPMNRHTSMRVGGPADVFLKARELEDIQAVFKIAHEEEIPCTILGAGSNTLVRDGGIRGFVLEPALKVIRIEREEDGFVDVKAEAGVGLTAFVNFCREQGLTGAEAWIGIPGSIGGAITMNAGARGVEVKDLLRETTLLNSSGELSTLSREKIDFGYRSSKLPRSSLVVSGIFRLTRGDPAAIDSRVKEFQKIRAETQPLNFPNLGSVFKNPEPAHKSSAKVTAGQLIEDAGLKNIRVGGARISEKHANFIINERDAKARDIIVLIGLVRDKVKEATGILLETEIRIVGE